MRVAENAPACAHVEGRFGDVGNHFCQTADATWCAEPLCEAGSYSKTGRGARPRAAAHAPPPAVCACCTRRALCMDEPLTRSSSRSGAGIRQYLCRVVRPGETPALRASATPRGVFCCSLPFRLLSMQCAEGKYSSAGATSCTLCEAGSYQPQAASSHCISCARGKYSPTPGAKDEETCLDCAAGKYSTSLGASAMNTCKDCPPYSSSQQASLGCACDAGYAGAFLACKACAPGTFKLASGPAACATCAQGKFKDTDGAGACLDCPGNSSTMAEGATVCMCTPGFTGPNGSTCRPCNSGTFKSTPGSHACVDPAASAFAPEETDVMVRLILGLPLSVQEFTPDVQVQFRASISTTAGVPLEKVNIHEVTSMDLRRSAGAQVHVEVAASSSSAADSVTRSLSIENINAQLARDGMPPAVILEKAYVINLVLVDNPSEGASMGEAEAEGSVLKDLKDGQATATAVSKSQTTLILAAVLLGCAMLFVLMVALCMIARKLEKSGGTGDAGQTCGDKEHDMQILTDAGSYPASLSKDDAVTDKLAQHISRESARQQSVSSQELHGLVSPQMESPYGQMSNFRGSTGTANFFSQLVFPDSHNDLEASAWECFTLDLDLDYDTIGKDGSELRAMFLSDLQQDLSNALALRGILTRPHCFDIVHLSRGSVIADIVVVDLEQLSCPAHALIDELQLQALDASSPLFAGKRINMYLKETKAQVSHRCNAFDTNLTREKAINFKS